MDKSNFENEEEFDEVDFRSEFSDEKFSFEKIEAKYINSI